MVYILVKNGEPCFAGQHKYNIRHHYEKLPLEEQQKVTPSVVIQGELNARTNG
jgi:hypothetical protein